jgi:hypothetical protein
MDGLQTVSPQDGGAPASEPASGGKMSMREAIRAAVTSQPEFSGGKSSPASEEPTPDDVVGAEPKATAKPDSGVPVSPGQDADASALKTGQTPAPTTPAQPGEHGLRDAAQAALPDAPARWPAAERAWFAALPDDGKRLVLEREKRFNTAYTQVTQDLADTRKKHEHLTSAFTPELRSQMQGAGLDERGAIDYLVRYHQLYETNPVAYVQAAIKAKGLSPQQIFPDLAGTSPSAQPQPPAEDEWVDPYVRQFTQRYDTELDAVKREQQTLISALRQQATSQQQQMLQSLEEVVSDFASTTDDAGNAAYPHIGEVFDRMLHLMNTDPQLRQIPPTRAREKLEQAYEMAVYLTPELRQRMIDGTVEQRLARQKADAEAERKSREQADAVARAKRASTARPSPGSDAPGARPGRTTIRDAARNAVMEHYRG